MRIQHWCALGLISFVLVGCDKSDTNTIVSSDSAPAERANAASYEDTSSAPPADADMADGSNAKPTEMPDGLLELPEGTDPQLVTAYQRFAGSEDARAIASLAQVSQAVGGQLSQDGDDAAYDFMLQAADLIRKAETEGLEIPDQIMSSFAYNEACALALKGEADEAKLSLQQAVELGFTDADHIRSDGDLASLRESESFDADLDKWLATAAEKVIEHAKEELAKGETFPFEFALTDIDGTEQSVEQYKGKVLIVDVWGTWCPPCRAEIPSFVKLQEAYGEDGFQMIGLNYEGGGDDEEMSKTVKDFVDANGINYPCALGTDEVQRQIPDFGGYPTTLFIDRSGKVRMKAVGLHEYSYLEAIVKALLEEDA